MAVELASCFFQLDPTTVTDGQSAEVRFEIDVYDSTTPNEAGFEVEPIPGVSAGLGLSPPGDAGAVIPTTRPSKAWFVINVNGVDHYAGELAVDAGRPEIELALQGMPWGFGVGSRVGDNQRAWTDWEVDNQGLPPLFGSDVNILVVYDFDGQLVRVPVVTGAINLQSTRPLIGNPLQITGKGFQAEYQYLQATLLKKADHGLTHGQLAAEVLALKVPAAKIAIDTSIGEPLIKRLEVDCSSPTDEARKILESFGYALQETRDGQFVARHMAPVDFQPVATLRIDRIHAEDDAPLESDIEGLPRCILVTGDRSIIPDASDAWTTVEREESRTEENIVIPRAKFSQIPSGGSAGDFTTVSGPPAIEQFLTTELITVRDTLFQGCLQVRERFAYHFFNPPIQRFKTALPSSPDGKPFTYFFGFSFEDTIPVKDDSSPLFRWPQARFVITDYTRETYFRDSEFALFVGGEIDRTRPIGKTGRLAKIHKGTGGWQTIEQALRSNPLSSTPADWSTVDVDSNLLLLGNGQPVIGPEEFWAGPAEPSQLGVGTTLGKVSNDLSIKFRIDSYVPTWKSSVETLISLLDAETPTSDERPGGWETSRIETTRGFEKPDGGAFQYLDGSESSDIVLLGRIIQTLARVFVPQGGSHTEILSGKDGENRPFPTVTRTVTGYLPVADVCDLESEAESNSVAVEGIACIDNDKVPDWTDIIGFDFGVETPAQASRLAQILLRRLWANDLEATFPLNVLLVPFDPVRVEAVGLGVDPNAVDFVSNAWVENVQHIETTAPTGEMTRLTQLLLKLPRY